LPGEIQAETRSPRLRLQTIEGFKNIFMLFDRNSGSLIPDFNGPGFINQNRNRAKASAVIDGIANDICQCLLDLQDVYFDPDLIGARLEGKITGSDRWGRALCTRRWEIPRETRAVRSFR
jgi:hypothetical protein